MAYMFGGFMKTKLFYGLIVSISMIAFNASSYAGEIVERPAPLLQGQDAQVNKIENILHELTLISNDEYKAYRKAYTKKAKLEKELRKITEAKQKLESIKPGGIVNAILNRRARLTKKREKLKNEYDSIKQKSDTIIDPKSSCANIYSSVRDIVHEICEKYTIDTSKYKISNELINPKKVSHYLIEVHDILINTKIDKKLLAKKCERLLVGLGLPPVPKRSVREQS